MGGEIKYLVPTGNDARWLTTGELPNDLSRYGAYDYHAFVINGGRVFDELNRTGIGYDDWLAIYKSLNELTDKMFEYRMKITDVPPLNVMKP